MKKILALILTAVVAVLGCMAFTGCSSDDTLVVYTEAGFAPFEYVKEGKIVGADVDIMQKVADKLGKKLKFEDVSFDIIVDAVKAGKLTKVGAAGLSITDARKEKVDFSTPYYTANLYVIYKASAESTYVAKTTDNTNGVYWETFSGKKVGYQTGTTANMFFGDEIAEGGSLYDGQPLATGTGYQDYTTALSALSTGNIDVIIMDELPAQQLIQGKTDYKCAPLYYKGEGENKDEVACDEYAIAVTKGETELLNAINEVLKELLDSKDAKGNNGVQQLVMKHLGM